VIIFSLRILGSFLAVMLGMILGFAIMWVLLGTPVGFFIIIGLVVIGVYRLFTKPNTYR
jgi:hypothetical protein